MARDVVFPESRIAYQEFEFLTGRWQGRDVIVERGACSQPSPGGLTGGELVGAQRMYPADCHNMLIWERELAPERRLAALNQAGFRRGFGAGNRIVVSAKDVPDLQESETFAGWDGIYRGMTRSAAPFWFVQQSIVRELIPEGVDPVEYPGIGHTGGYGPRELLRAGLFAFASQGGYSIYPLPIGADADHAIIIGRDEESLAASLALNKTALDESADYTKFTVDTSHLFDFPVMLDTSAQRLLRDLFRQRSFEFPNILFGQESLAFSFEEDEILRLGRKYWRACAVHKEIYDYTAGLRAGRPFDYELSLDETPEPTAPRDLLFYLVLLQGMGVPERGIASAGPNIGFIKRHDYEGDLPTLWKQANACASILERFGAMLSVHSADGVRADTGKGPGVDAVLLSATGGDIELKVADVYQEVLWQVLAASPERAEREIFLESWRRTYEAARLLATVYDTELASCTPVEAQRLLATAEGREQILKKHGAEALNAALATIGYGLPVFRLAAALLPRTLLERPDPEQELFRRFMFLPYRQMRPALFQTMSREGWQRLADALEEATLARIRAMKWEG
jgi:hypothetical protein